MVKVLATGNRKATLDILFPGEELRVLYLVPASLKIEHEMQLTIWLDLQPYGTTSALMKTHERRKLRTVSGCCVAQNRVYYAAYICLYSS